MLEAFWSFHVCFSLLHQSVEAGLEAERLQREGQETQWVSEAEAQAQVLRFKAQLKAQERQAVQLESSCRAVDRSLGQSSKKLQVRQMLAVLEIANIIITGMAINKGLNGRSVRMTADSLTHVTYILLMFVCSSVCPPQLSVLFYV